MVSGNYFLMLGASAATGRTLGPSDEHPSSAGVPVVLSHRFWTRAFANSRSILGATLIIQGKPFVIAGIMQKSFFGTRIDESPDVWLPLSAQPLLSNKSLTDPDPDRHFAILAGCNPALCSRRRNRSSSASTAPSIGGRTRTIRVRRVLSSLLLTPLSRSAIPSAMPSRSWCGAWARCCS